MKLVLALLLQFALLSTYAGILIESEFTEITVTNLVDYSSTHTITLYKSETTKDYFSLSLREGEVLSELTVSIVKNGKTKKVNVGNQLSESTIDNSSFFSGATIFYFPIEESGLYEIRYEVKSKETIFIAAFHKSGRYDALSFLAHVYLPEGLVLSDHLGRRQSGRIVIDHTQFNDSLEAIHTLIHPAQLSAEEYFSNWFDTRLKDLSVFNDKNQLLKAHVGDVKDSTALATAIFNYVKGKITYVAIENGINAIVPRECNFVHQKGRGDCKDMANLLCAIYKQYGFEAYPAISRTRAQRKPFDFPSLSLANHMICVLFLNDQPVFLDATERNCLFGDPSLQIFNTELFLVGKQPHFLEVSGQPASLSKTEIDVVFRPNSERGWNVELNIHASGKMNSLIGGMVEKDQKSAVRLAKFIVDYNWQKLTQIVGDTATTLRFESEVPTSDVLAVGNSLFVDFIEKIDISKLCLLAYGDTMPSFKGEMCLKVEFPGEIKTAFAAFENSLLTVERPVDKPATLICTLRSNDAVIPNQEWSALQTQFTTRFKNPIEIKNEKP